MAGSPVVVGVKDALDRFTLFMGSGWALVGWDVCFGGWALSWDLVVSIFGAPYQLSSDL
ncbi:MAG: hypothetical protein ABSA39_00635 [Edaphobacter sp.]